jgi:hypothetical protein
MEPLKKIIVIYTFITAAFTIMLIPPLTNYIDFYKAIERHKMSLKSAELDVSQLRTGTVKLSVTFNISNPTNFKGLKVTSITCNLKYKVYGQNIYKNLPGLTEVFQKPVEIPPNRFTEIPIDFTFTYSSERQEVKDFFALLSTKPVKIEFIFQGQYVLYAYTYPFTISMGPFEYEIILNY